MNKINLYAVLLSEQVLLTHFFILLRASSGYNFFAFVFNFQCSRNPVSVIHEVQTRTFFLLILSYASDLFLDTNSPVARVGLCFLFAISFLKLSFICGSYHSYLM